MAVPKEESANVPDAKDDEETEKDWMQIVTIIVSSLCATSAGMLFVWTSPSIPKIVEDKTNYDITLEEASYFTVLNPLGQIVSCLLFSKLNDIIGRKRTLLLIAVPQIASWLLLATAKSVYLFYLSRFITGFGDSCLFSTLPMYIGEIATPRVRGSWGNAMTFMIYVGQLAINVIGSYFSVPQAAYISVAVPIVFACTFVFMPESPYYCIMRGRYDDARRSLQSLRRVHNVEGELDRLKADVARQMSESGTWTDLFAIKSNRKAIYAGMFLRASQQMGGIGAIVVYTQYIFLRSGGDVSASTSAIILCVLLVVLNFSGALVLDRIGRRQAYMFSCLVCGIILSCMAVYFFIDTNVPELDVTVLNWIPLAGMISYIVSYSFGLGIVPTLMLGELFSTSIKAKGLCLLNVIFAFLVCTMTKFFQVLDTHVGLYSPFLFYGICCVTAAILTLYFVPETKGKTLEEIQQQLKSSKKSKTVP